MILGREYVKITCNQADRLSSAIWNAAKSSASFALIVVDRLWVYVETAGSFAN
jgi:hypothetical protein